MNLFADHPPLEQRLAALQRLEAQLQGVRLTPVGLRDILTGRRPGQGAGARPAVRDHDGLRDLETEHQIEPARRAAIVFQALATSEFEATSRKWKRSSPRPAARAARPSRPSDDSYGYRWMILRNPEAPSVEDLAVGINAVSSSIETAGYGERLLCAVFAFDDAQRQRRVYCIYNYKRGYWYPFVPGAGDGPGALDRARAADQGADRLRAADRARARALVPPLGDPDLGRSAARRRPAP